MPRLHRSAAPLLLFITLAIIGCAQPTSTARPRCPEQLPQDTTWLQTGRDLIARSAHAEAIACFDRALAQQPDDLDALTERGIAFGQLQQWTEAIASFDRAIASHPNTAADAWLHRGGALKHLGQLETAIASYERGYAINPNRHGVVLSISQLLVELERYDDALANYSRFLRRADVNNPTATRLVNFRQGNLLAQLERYEAAIASYDRALTLHPTPEIAAILWFYRGTALPSTAVKMPSIASTGPSRWVRPIMSKERLGSVAARY